MTFKQRIDSRYGPGTIKQIRELEQMHLKLTKRSNHLTFLYKCNTENLTPHGISLKSPFRSKKASKIMLSASKQLLKERIAFHHREKRLLQTNIESEKSKLASLIGPEFDSIVESIQNRAKKVLNADKIKKISKFEKLRPKNDTVVDNTNQDKDVK